MWGKVWYCQRESWMLLVCAWLALLAVVSSATIGSVFVITGNVTPINALGKRNFCLQIRVCPIFFSSLMLFCAPLFSYKRTDLRKVCDFFGIKTQLHTITYIIQIKPLYTSHLSTYLFVWSSYTASQLSFYHLDLWWFCSSFYLPAVCSKPGEMFIF